MRNVLKFIDLQRMAYGPAYEEQRRRHSRILDARDAGSPVPGDVLLVEHERVITVSNRRGAAANLLATPAELEAAGVAVEPTDRGGDITYHGPGQLVVYPILDLNLLNLGLHDYMRMLESAVIETCAHFGVAAQREEKATGVWAESGGGSAKVCAMGVRIKRWVSMHGLALNVTTNLAHFGLINPCGLGRPVTSLERLLGPACPSMAEVKRILGARLEMHAGEALERAGARREAAAGAFDPASPPLVSPADR